MGHFAEQFLHALPNEGHPGGAAHQHHFVDLRRLQPGVLQREAAWADRLFDQIHGQSLELIAGELASVLALAGW